MNDRFKFRAKDKETGEWRYGYYAELPCGLGSSGVNSEYADTDSFILTCTKKQSALYSNAEPHEVFHCEQFRVDGKTLSQCTGIQDKNGKLIYEGDVLKIHTVWEHRPYYYAIVKWQRNRYKFQKIGKGVFLGDIAPLKDFANSEVVGNIYENPGLLGVGE